MTRRLLVTTALPYANGHIHLGHLVGYLMTDMYVRYQNLRGNRAVYVCADDTHGTAIMIRARQEGRSELDVIRDMQASHEADFAAFGIRFDHYGSTHSDECRFHAGEIWKGVRTKGLVAEREVSQLFDTVQNTFLADRFVKGKCPKCQSPDQYGDSCDKCGASYSATEVIDPISTISGTRPELRSAKHLFIEIEKLREPLVKWLESGAIEPEVVNYLKGQFLSERLHDWDVSRPAPYFGFEIPDAPGHYWYVWFDAPIGYIASSDQWAKKNGEKLDDWWRSRDCEVVHFLGKDIVYFHTLFWPGMLLCGEFSLPKREVIHGHLTVNGEKMSKSKGTFIRAKTYLDAGLDPSYLRYFYASKLSPRPDDLDLDLSEFANKVNADLVGKVVNLASRTARFVEKTGLSTRYPDDGGLFANAAQASDEIGNAYERCELSQVTRVVMALADRANEYVEAAAPWALAKDPNNATKLQDACTVALNLFRQVAIYLSPILPKLAEQAGALFSQPSFRFDDVKTPLVDRPVAKFQHLMQRVDPAKLEKMIELGREAAPGEKTEKNAPEQKAAAPAKEQVLEPLAPQITIDDFTKIDLRVAEVLACEKVEKSNKLLKLRVTLGGLGERTIFAGIQKSYAPTDLIGKRIVVVANLAPREMKGIGVSEGMVCAAGGEPARVLLPDVGALPGDRVH